jgi:hypothetical protein
MIYRRLIGSIAVVVFAVMAVMIGACAAGEDRAAS